jgi:hypothetical protein
VGWVVLAFVVVFTLWVAALVWAYRDVRRIVRAERTEQAGIPESDW